jgi:cysteinyl-tRNA synthetase
MPDAPERTSADDAPPAFELHNTRTRQVEPLVPSEETDEGHPHLRFYACGPTVYTFAHVGNFRSFLTADLILRTAQALGWEATYVSNITDVGHLTEDDLTDPAGEDKMTKALEEAGQRFANIYDLARFYTEALTGDWHRLNLREPTVRPRATEHMAEQIQAVEQLVENGHAYETERGVYFSVESFPDYGRLSGNEEAQQLQSTGRETVSDPEKRHPRDFALWKKDPDHLMQWHSPWGWGFPGWHIECSVMGRAYLGETFDLHTGGEDLIFPHHECEIAQIESLRGNGSENGDPAITHWAHTRFLQVEGEKMSKSKGNFFTVRDLTLPEDEGGEGIDPLALRLTLISGQYRKPFNFTRKTLRDSAQTVRRYQEVHQQVEKVLEQGEAGDDHAGDHDAEQLDDIYDRTLAALCDDLNTPAALAASYEGVKLLRGLDSDMNAATARRAMDWLEKTNALLGIVWHDAAARDAPGAFTETDDDPFAEKVEALLNERTQARADGDYDRADAIRDRLVDEMGVEIMDGPDGTDWRRKLSV